MRDAVCSKRDSCSPSAAVGDSGGGGASVEADNGASPGVLGDMDALGEEAVDSVTTETSSEGSYLTVDSRFRGGRRERLRSVGRLSKGDADSLATGQ